ncbi:protealysin inhibitor emfourin [Pseudomonas sp. AM8]|uniref:protealysin inhibitor emfourin n=1 Tax=Pseudomonas sp. AM8 TaxID=2983368 RepID=UPI002E822852|nr:protealysin inhibitor emfourin [Pseudomonas sp. AM8]
MQISIKENGGPAVFPGLTKPRTVELNTLPEPDQQELRQLIEASNFFQLPQSTTPEPGNPGQVHYTLTVKEGQQEHTVCVLAPVKSQALDGLVQCVRRHIRS